MSLRTFGALNALQSEQHLTLQKDFSIRISDIVNILSTKSIPLDWPKYTKLENELHKSDFSTLSSIAKGIEKVAPLESRNILLKSRN